MTQESSSNLNKQLNSLTPDTLLEFFEIDFSTLQANFDQFKLDYGITFGADPIYRFCPMINGTNPIIWQGVSFQPLPIRIEGFEHKSEGGLPRPILTLANPDGIFSRIVYSNQDFTNCKVTRKRTFAKFLDLDNFQNRNQEGGTNSLFALEDKEAHFDDDIYYVNRKVSENKKSISFELISPLEMDNAKIPARKIISNFCPWTYRCSVGCKYSGLPIESIEGVDLTENFLSKKNQGLFSNSSSINEALLDKDLGKVRADRYPEMLKSVPEWSPFGHQFSEESKKFLEGSEGGIFSYKLGDLVKIVNSSSSNPYVQAPQVFVCTKTHTSPAEFHPYLSKSYWAKDECSKTISACKKRFPPRGSVEEKKYATRGNIFVRKEGTIPQDLRFGGFPGTEEYPFE